MIHIKKKKKLKKMWRLRQSPVAEMVTADFCFLFVITNLVSIVSETLSMFLVEIKNFSLKL